MTEPGKYLFLFIFILASPVLLVSIYPVWAIFNCLLLLVLLWACFRSGSTRPRVYLIAGFWVLYSVVCFFSSGLYIS